MPKYTFTVIDVTGIQGYIFGSNKLRENIGASQLVECAINIWMQAALPRKHNLTDSGAIQSGEQWQIELNQELMAEVVLRGGGNLLLLFRSLADAKAMVGRLSRTLLEAAPGLEIAAAHQEFDWGANKTDKIGGADYQNSVHQQLFAKLNEYKQQRPISTPLLGLSVTLECRATRLPAFGFESNPPGDEPRRPLSADVLSKLRYAEMANERLKSIFPSVAASGYRFRSDFDYLGGTEGEQDYIAIVHADANSMGQRFNNVITHHDDNRACLNALRELSQAVEDAGTHALQATVDRLLLALEQPVQPDQPASQCMREFRDGLKKNNGQRFLPFRPIVYGGDDITFVCDGRLGLTLAAAYLEEWERYAAALPGGAAYACASAVIVKTHYPFARAYALCEAMCKQVKNTLRQQGNPQLSALDWHFSLSSISGTIKQIRTREYTVNNGNAANLVMRPVTLHKYNSNPFGTFWQTWEKFESTVREFAYGERWHRSRNKVKALREPLRAGGPAVEQFRNAYRLPELPELDKSTPILQATGWAGICGYFDAIEALDFYMPLPELAHEER